MNSDPIVKNHTYRSPKLEHSKLHKAHKRGSESPAGDDFAKKSARTKVRSEILSRTGTKVSWERAGTHCVWLVSHPHGISSGSRDLGNSSKARVSYKKGAPPKAAGPWQLPGDSCLVCRLAKTVVHLGFRKSSGPRLGQGDKPGRMVERWSRAGWLLPTKGAFRSWIWSFFVNNWRFEWNWDLDQMEASLWDCFI